MEEKNLTFIIKGMNRDINISKVNEQYSYENINVRITPNEDNTLFSITNERGTLDLKLELKGTVLGHQVCMDKAVLFTEDNGISRIYLFDGSKLVLLVESSVLNFSTSHPIESLYYYENENVSKVYWTDNLNQPRMIILPSTKYNINYNEKLKKDPTFFDFSGDMRLEESINIEKVYNAAGLFPSGTIQYCFNYYNMYGKETNIAEVSSIYYLSHSTRGGSPDEKTTSSFKITIDNVDSNYEYIKVYSIIRTSEEGEPIVSKVYDNKIEGNSVSFIDNNVGIEPLEKYYLYYVGGKSIICNTITSKDGTLFLGNLEVMNKPIPEDIKKSIVNFYKDSMVWKEAKTSEQYNNKYNEVKFYKEGLFANEINSGISKYEKTNFKYKEHYIIGIQFQYNNGEFSSPIFIKDSVCNIKGNKSSSKIILELPSLPEEIKTSLKSFNIKRIRPVIVDNTLTSKSFIAQGVLNPVVYNVGDRLDNSPFSQSSWFYRPIHLDDHNLHLDYTNIGVAEFRERALPVNSLPNAELGNTEIEDPLIRLGKFPKGLAHHYNNIYALDYSMFTMNTPEDLHNLEYDNLKLRIIGIAPIHSTHNNINVTSEGTTYISNEELRNKLGRTHGKGMINDHRIIYNSDKGVDYYNSGLSILAFPVFYDSIPHLGSVEYRVPIYPFHPDGSITNSEIENVKQAVLKNNARYSYKYSNDIVLLDTPIDIPIYKPVYVDSEENKNYLIEYYNGKESVNGVYRGYSDKIVSGGKYSGSITKGINVNYSFLVESTSEISDNISIPYTPRGEGVFINSRTSLAAYLNDIRYLSNSDIEKQSKRSVGINVGYKSAKHLVLSAKPNDVGVVSKLPLPDYMDVRPKEFQDEEYENASGKEKEMLQSVRDIKVDITPIETLARSIFKLAIHDPSIIEKLDGNISPKKLNDYNVTLKNYNIEISRITSKYKEGEQYSEEDSRELERLKTSAANTKQEINDYISNSLKNAGIDVNNLSRYVHTEYGVADFTNDLTETLKEEFGKVSDRIKTSIFIENDKVRGANFFEQSINAVLGSTLGLKGFERLFTGGYGDELREMFRNLNSEMEKLMLLQLDSLSIKKGTPEYDTQVNIIKSLLIPDSVINVIDTDEEIDWDSTLITGSFALGAALLAGPAGAIIGGVVTLVNLLFSKDDYVNPRSLTALLQWYLAIREFSKKRMEYLENNNSEEIPFYSQAPIKYNKRYNLPDSVLSAITDPETGKKLSYLYIGELYREVPLVQEEVELSNKEWIISGYSSSLDESVLYVQGDVFKERFDAIKTMPIDSCKNKITECMSFMVETRENLGFRYDRNKENLDYFNLTTDNTNKINPVYNNKDNYFKYYTISSKDILDNFPNRVTWTNRKIDNGSIDLWNSLSLVNTLPLDGDKGELHRLIKANDEIFFFQNNGFGVIPFNSRVQIPVSDGIPIEISNGYRVEGKKYISDTIGCINKSSIVNGQTGLYFIDDNTHTIYRYSNNLDPISDTKGFRMWTTENHSNGYWDPDNFNIKSYYDEVNKRIFFSTKESTLCFNEGLQEFESFYTYKNITSWFALDNRTFSTSNDYSTIWENNKGEFSKFYNTTYPFSVEYRVNPDKGRYNIFTNIEFRGDSWEGDTLLDKVSFNKIYVKNEYQYGESLLKYNKTSLSNLKKKFRVWRADIPREKGTMNRIKNNWCNIKLETSDSNDKTILHELSVIYYSN